MDQEHPTAAPVLSTPETRLFEDQQPENVTQPRLDEQQIHTQYEIERTVAEIRAGRRKRIALQFPDPMLVDAPRVFQLLSRGLKEARSKPADLENLATLDNEQDTVATSAENDLSESKPKEEKSDPPEKLFILADTSYGACCVDEVAAEHAEADAVVHYGRSCLSTTARLPVIYVFTKPPLDLDHAQQSFEHTYSDKGEKIIIMADIPYQGYLEILSKKLEDRGYTSLFTTSIVHDTASPLPNRTLPPNVKAGNETLSTYSLFHVSSPPPALLLTVSSAVRSIHIYDTDHTLSCSGTTHEDTSTTPSTPTALPTITTTSLLRRRYALLTRLTTAPIIGILINTLSIASYMTMLAHLKRLIAASGKKSYTFVVGKVNAAKIANFAEVGGWVVVGCWESSLFDSAEFWKPVVTPWELEVALTGDERRIWGGKGEGERWRSDFEGVLGRARAASGGNGSGTVDGDGAEKASGHHTETAAVSALDDDARPHQHIDATARAPPPPSPSADLNDASASSSEEESAPPDFDLRTGRYVSHSRPMAPAPERLFNPGSTPERSLHPASTSDGPAHSTTTGTTNDASKPPTSLSKRRKGDIATINGAVSPAAAFFREKRSWQGLGTEWGVEYDAEGRLVEQEAARVEVGRRGIARGYVDGEEEKREKR